jgi:hypothetical protein
MNRPFKTGYLLLFRSDEWYKELSQDELQKLISQNNAWIERLAAQGKAKAGQPLARQGAVVSGKNGNHLSDGPFAESKEVIGGYLVLDVETFDEAVAIARTSPSLPYGTSIEVRPFTDECPLDACERESAPEDQFATT